MKKIIFGCLLLCLTTVSAVSAQDYEVYNKLGSDGVFMTKGDQSGFGGVYDTVSGLIHYSRFSVQAQYKLKLDPNRTFDSYSLSGVAEKANVWFRPITGLEVAVGNWFYQALPGAYMIVYDEYTENGWYGKEHVGATFTFAPVTIGANLASMTLNDNFSMKVNFGVNVALAKNFNIGGAYRMDHESIGIFANYGGVDGFYFGGGYTYKGISLPQTFLKDTYNIDLSGGNNHVLDFTMSYTTGNFQFAGDAELVITEKDWGTPFYAGGLFVMGITQNVALKADAKWFTVFRDGENENNPWAMELYPRIVFTSGAHELTGGVKFTFRDTNLIKDNSEVKTDFAIPVSWKYTFK